MGFIDTSVAIVRTGSELLSLKIWSFGHSFAASVWNGSVADSRLTDILKDELESDLGQIYCRRTIYHCQALYYRGIYIIRGVSF
jgi:hypothetical protein